MAEAFGVAAGILTVVELTAKVISKCKHLIETAHDAPKDLRHILIEISSLKAALESFQYLANTDTEFSDTVRDLATVEGAVTGCQDTVEALAQELDGLALSKCTRPAVGKRQRLTSSLNWCLKESKTQKLLDEAARHKATITLTLLGDITRDVKEVKECVNGVQGHLHDVDRRKICDWIEHTNPAPIHDQAHKLYEEHTCHWIHRMNQWTEWLACQQRTLWIHGIPGAGKTILASHLVEEVKSYCRALNRSRVKCLYYYCHYRHNQDEAKPLLHWIVSQLCRQLDQIPSNLEGLYHTNHGPSSKDMIDALKSMLHYLDVLYIIVDAADESSPRENLLAVLMQLGSHANFKKIQLLVTSRRYADIESVLRPLADYEIPMSNPVVDQDIRHFVKSRLQSHQRFTWWSDELREEVLDSLVHGAKGMFRWAVCQLDRLRRRRTTEEIRKAIKELPETLDDTYERIFLEISQEDWSYARSALVWICAHGALDFAFGIPSESLAAAVMNHDRGSDRSSFTNAKMSGIIEDILGCLITPIKVDEETEMDYRIRYDSFELAHYTVQEFLYSDRIVSSKAATFALSADTCAYEVLTVALRRPIPEVDTWYYEIFDCYCYEVSRIGPFAWESLIVKDDELWNLLQDRFDTRYFEYGHVHTTYLKTPRTTEMKFVEYAVGDQIEDSIRHAQNVKDLLEFGLKLMAEDMIDKADADLMCSSTLPIFVSCLPTYLTFLDSISIDVEGFGHDSYLQDCLDILARKMEKSSILVHAVASHFHELTCGSECVLEKLLGLDGPMHSSTSGITLLQVAAHRWDLAGINLLLRFGADANGVSDPHGQTPAYIDKTWASSSPLHIVRNAEYGLDHLEHILFTKEDRERDKPRIEQLLLDYGARDFTTCAASSHSHNPVPDSDEHNRP